MAEASHHEEEQLGKIYDAKVARRLLRYLKPYRRLVVNRAVSDCGGESGSANRPAADQVGGG